ncbi:MAG: succinate dehydrogenase iron-sulfur subunit [bacterium]|nr:succinate dehydrogenase iron-sulfur subunit [bacterium]
MAASHNANGSGSRKIQVRVLRQPAPGESNYWERHEVDYEPDMNVISVLQRIAAKSKTSDGKEVAPVAWDCNCLEEVCGACTMVVNGKVRQSCTALVDRLMEDNPQEIELQPMQKFPVVRDLVVERKRLFRALERVHAWVDVDGSYELGPGPLESPETQEERYPYSQCMSCGCCVDACPQYVKIELEQFEDETDEAFEKRQQEAFDAGFVGPHAIGQTVLFNLHPTGKMAAGERLDSLMEEGGIQVCGNAQNCVAVCPKEIPLTTAIGKAGRATTVRSISKFFGGE